MGIPRSHFDRHPSDFLIQGFGGRFDAPLGDYFSSGNSLLDESMEDEESIAIEPIEADAAAAAAEPPLPVNEE